MSVLCYHSVDADWDTPIAVTPDSFAQHSAWLHRCRTVVPALDLLEMQVASRRTPRRTVALTFDDGFADFIDGALPALRDYRLPATMFLVARTLEEGQGRADWLIPQPDVAPATLTESEVLELHAMGVSFGSHSWAHRDLRELTEEECVTDLRDSREMIEDLLHAEAPLLAYPYGHHAEHVRRAAATAGYRFALSLPQGPEPRGPHSMPRAGVYRGDNLTALRIKSSRWFIPARMASPYPRPGRLGGLLRSTTSR